MQKPLFRVFTSSTENLIKTLGKEIEYRLIQSKQQKPDYSFISKKKLKILTRPLSKQIKLIHNNYQIEFLAKSPYNTPSPESLFYQGNEGIYDNTELDYTIKISKKNKCIQYKIHCDEAKMYIETISYHSDKKKLSGRSFSCLHEKTQEGFAGILSELELDSPLAYFIDNYSVLREEQLELE